MTSKTSICNKALRKIGVSTVINIDTDTSPQATACKAVYDDLLLEVLREHEWNFAIFRKELAQDAAAPAYEYSYRFVLPTFPVIVKLLDVYNNNDYQIENGYLLTNETTVKIKYVGKETDPNKYDSLFIETFSLRIAQEVCFELTGDKALASSMFELYQLALQNAKDKNYQEDNATPITGSRYNAARQSYFSNNISQLINNA